MKASSTIGGMAGAIALTLINESIKKVRTDAPRLDLLGENALARLMNGNSFLPKTLGKFFPLAGDLVSNTLFYALAKGKSSGNTLTRGALLGLAAGVGAITLPKPLGLKTEPTTRTTQTAVMTVAWYLIGGLVAAAVINQIERGQKVPENQELKNRMKTAGKELTKKVSQMV